MAILAGQPDFADMMGMGEWDGLGLREELSGLPGGMVNGDPGDRHHQHQRQKTIEHQVDDLVGMGRKNLRHDAL